LKRTIIAAGALALGAGIFVMPNALADESVDTPIGTITQEGDASGGSLTADGTGPGPLSGFIQAEGTAGPPPEGDVCADDNGSPESSTSPTCASDPPPAP
jgi:hypothetical protein